MQKVLRSSIAVAFSCIAAASAGAERPLFKREILAIYDSSKEPQIEETKIHRNAEMPLNHLGYIVRYHDIATELPDNKTIKRRYAAVLSWFSGSLEKPRPFLRWVTAVAKGGVKFIVLGSIGGDYGRDSSLIDDVLDAIGLQHAGAYIAMTNGVRPTFVDPAAFEFELKLGPDLPGFPAIIPAPLRPATPILEVELPRLEGIRRAVLAATGPGGGFVAPNYAMRYDQHSGKRAWLINPFVFFARALGLERFPIPDVTTVSGRRLYFSHINGGGWRNRALMSPYRQEGQLAAEVMLDELIAPYPDLPVTLGIIAGDVTASEGGNSHSASIARRIFALPQVEVGSHTYTHIFNWGLFQRYSRATELSQIEQASSGSSYLEQLANWVGFGRSKDMAVSEQTGRAYTRHPFDLGIEVERAVQHTEKLAPPGKRVMVYQWSGNTRPFEAAILRTRRAGLPNINGGDTRFDAEFPSIAYVAPISRMVGKERQIYAVGANEIIYTNSWTGPYFGFRNLEQTVRNTEEPRRLKGFNINYHVYSAERQASLDAVKAMLDLARSMRLAPIATSHYARIADSFFATEVRKLGPHLWSVGNRGHLNTVRFDKAEPIAVDLARSEGVLGATRYAGSLYAALDPAVPTAIVAVRPRTDNHADPAGQPMLIDARWTVRELSWSSLCHFAYRASGFGRGEFTWRAAPSTLYDVRVRQGTALVWNGDVSTDADGKLELLFPNTRRDTVQVELACRAPHNEASN